MTGGVVSPVWSGANPDRFRLIHIVVDDSPRQMSIAIKSPACAPRVLEPQARCVVAGRHDLVSACYWTGHVVKRVRRVLVPHVEERVADRHTDRNRFALRE